MARTIRDVMTADPHTLDSGSTVQEAAAVMRDADVGNVLVSENGEVCGIVTDRDITVRVTAEGRAPGDATLAEICSHDLVSLSPDDSVDDAVRLMRERAVRRLPVVEGGQAVGIVALGDLAVEQQPGSALADISASDPNL